MAKRPKGVEPATPHSSRTFVSTFAEASALARALAEEGTETKVFRVEEGFCVEPLDPPWQAWTDEAVVACIEAERAQQPEAPTVDDAAPIAPATRPASSSNGLKRPGARVRRPAFA